jgi:hypothetical protein
MARSLHGVWRKIERTDKHITDLEGELAAFQEAKAKTIVRQDDPDEPTERDQWVIRDASISDRFRLVLGDTVHNLRTTLDYLVDALVRANPNGPDPGPHTAFPVWRRGGIPTAQQYESLVAGKVRGATDTVIKAFCQLEPYEGGKHQLLWALDQLDILDKHRLLLVIAARPRNVGINPAAAMRKMLRDTDPEWAARIPDMWIGLVPSDREPLEDGSVLYGAPKTEHLEPDDQPKFALDITLGEPPILERDPVLPAITQMRQAAMEVIQAFHPLLWSQP